MRCLVLAAGMSTRLASITGGAPKPLAPINGVPVLKRNLRWLRRYGIAHTFINLHYRADEIKAAIGNGSADGVRVSWSEENPILGTAGAAKKLERELTHPAQLFGGAIATPEGDASPATRIAPPDPKQAPQLPAAPGTPPAPPASTLGAGVSLPPFAYGEAVTSPPPAASEIPAPSLVARTPFLLVYGDNVFDFDLSKFIAQHVVAKQADPAMLGTIALFDPNKHRHTGIAGGRVRTELTGAPLFFGDAGRITQFIEGAAPDAPGYVNAAAYVLEAEALEGIPPPPQATDWARDVFPKLLAAGKHLRGHLIDGYCLGIDTPESYQRAQEIVTASETKPRVVSGYS
ncbi:MAG TPA: NDP-sugar synthase [Planctomycetota bacterium]|nr:NDP-sugar synthase [Planctomycetota bacterium]